MTQGPKPNQSEGENRVLEVHPGDRYTLGTTAYKMGLLISLYTRAVDLLWFRAEVYRDGVRADGAVTGYGLVKGEGGRRFSSVHRTLFASPGIF